MNSAFWQIVTKSTRKSKTLTVVITDLPMLYQAPKVVPPIPVDVIGKGVASDHNGVLVLPVTSKQPKRKTEVKFRSVRPLPESQKLLFGSYLAENSWDILKPGMNPTELVEAFESHSASIIDGFFPLKTISFTEFDKPYMTEELKKIRRKRQRIYRKEGKSDTYLELKNTFDSN